MDMYTATGEVQRIDKPRSTYPTRLVGLLEAAGNGQAWVGTASLIAPRFVVTAAHCLEGATSGSVKFGYDINDVTNDSAKYSIVACRIPTAYNGGGNRAWDVGVAELETAYMGEQYCLKAPADPAPRQFGFWVGLDNVLIYGYPATRKAVTASEYARIEVGHQYVVGGKKHGVDVSENLLQYQFDTRGGLSGAPILLPDLKTIVGVHASWNVVDDKQMGIGTLFTPAVTAWISGAVTSLMNATGPRPFLSQG